MCAGSHLANRELYTAFIRLIVAFQMVPAQNRADDPVLDALEASLNKTALTLDPKPFKVGFRARDPVKLQEWIKASEENTKHL